MYLHIRLQSATLLVNSYNDIHVAHTTASSLATLANSLFVADDTRAL